jgi:hypothetical protein
MVIVSLALPVTGGVRFVDGPAATTIAIHKADIRARFHFTCFALPIVRAARLVALRHSHRKSHAESGALSQIVDIGRKICDS